MSEEPTTLKDMQSPPPHIGILQILGGAYVARAVSCLAQLGIPDLLESGPKSAEELAKKIGAQPQALYRLMRATACVGVLAEEPDRKFSQTPLSAVLRSTGNPSLRELAIMGGREWHGRAWTSLDYCVRTRKQALEQIYGTSTFEFMKQNSQEAHIFHDWPHDPCVKILKACRKGVNPGGRLLVVDCVIQPGSEFSSAKFLDLQMLIFPAGLNARRLNFARCGRHRA